MVKEKNSNAELLRLLCMFFIVVHHAVLYSGVMDEPFGADKIISVILYIGGKFGADCFFVISAWFLIDREFRFSRIVNIWRTVWVYGILFMALNYAFGFRAFASRDIFEAAFPVLSNSYWFVTAYVGLLLLSPFMNRIIHQLSHREYLFLLGTLSFMVMIPSTLTLFEKPYQSDSHFLLCVFIYFLTGYFKRDFQEVTVTKKKLIIVFSFSLLFLIFSGIAILIAEDISGAGIFKGRATVFMSGESLPMLAASLSCSMLVLKYTKHRNNVIINMISKGCFDVYLIHMNHFVYMYLWNDLFDIRGMFGTEIYLPFILGSCTAVFIVCLIAGNVRSCVDSFISRKKTKNSFSKLDDIFLQ